MDTWHKVKQRIENKGLDSKTWTSDKKNLLKILDAAHKMHLDPGDIERAPLSNLRTIIKDAKQAIQDDDHAKLSELFRKAAELSTVDLRLRIGIRQQEELCFDKVVKHDVVYYRLTVTAEQFDRIRTSSKAYFLYKENTKHNDK